MNYFAHGFRSLDHPYVLAGTAVPDWLCVADRNVRLRKQRVLPFLSDPDPIHSAVAAGICRHLDDDAWFHSAPSFYEVSGEITREIRAVLESDDGFRCGFLGHIVTELLLDAVLMEHHRLRLDIYYATLRRVDADRLQQAVNRMAKRPTGRLKCCVGRFLQEEFLRDYLHNEGLLFRLNQVMRRVRLPSLPSTLLPVIQNARQLLRRRRADLLPE